MEPVKAFYDGYEYHTPEREPGWFTRTFPSFSFYRKIVGVVWRASRKARLGKYDATDWYNSSVEVVQCLEQSGCRLHVTGMEHLDGLDRPCIFIGNHMSTLETFVLPSLVLPHGLDMTFVVKRSLTEYPIFKHVMNSRNPVVVDRVNPRDDLKTVMTEGAKRLEDGYSIAIFPQHTRTVDFDPEQFNTIGIKLASRTGATVVPVALLTWAWSPGNLMKDYGPIIPSRPIHFAFGEPFEVSGKGQEEHQRIIDFIQTHLGEWRVESKAG